MQYYIYIEEDFFEYRKICNCCINMRYEFMYDVYERNDTFLVKESFIYENNN